MSAPIATRVKFHEARRHFAEGGTVVVSERGHETWLTVYPQTTTHNRDTIKWDDLVEMVRMWSGRYPNQRYYVVAK